MILQNVYNLIRNLVRLTNHDVSKETHEISYKNYLITVPKKHEIPSEIRIRKMCSKKHEVAEVLGKKRRQSSFTVSVHQNERREGTRTLVKILWSGQRSKTKILTQSTPLAPSEHIPRHPTPSHELTRMHAFASPPTELPFNHNSISSHHVKSFSTYYKTLWRLSRHPID
jgi:hypothetical protein